MFVDQCISFDNRTGGIGTWEGPLESISFESDEILQILRGLEKPCFVVRNGGKIGITQGGQLCKNMPTAVDLIAASSSVCPTRFGAASFLRDHKVKYTYMTGAMAKGIASEELVIALGKNDLLGVFGAGGLSLDRIEKAIHTIQQALPDKPYAFNLIHAPKEPETEWGTADLYLKYGVRTVEASSFMNITPSIVRYRLAGLDLASDGSIQVNNKLIAKLSRRELASQFMVPAPAKIVQQLMQAGLITEQQARLAEQVPIADDITIEADSGGHTDNRPLVVLLPSILMLRDEMREKHGLRHTIRIGAAGGISTPQSILAAYMMGADYVVTGSINQSCREAGTSDPVKQLLAQVAMTDVVMAPESDMFENGFKVQVLKKGSLFPMRAQKLYDYYQRFESIEAIPIAERQRFEQQIFKKSLDDVWRETQAYFVARDPNQLERAQDPKVQMALVFRWYLGQSSRWAIQAEAEREIDYQIWCGPSMGAFNNWVKFSPWAQADNRQVAEIAQKLMEEAALLYRVQNLRMQGVNLGMIKSYL
jgi:trans-AT polyketide synthase/acyltransferase/oxidoreductase domain-containing protein